MDPRVQAQVSHRARNRCEYCHFPAQFTRVPFQIDHIIAQKHRGKTTSANLALSCFFCNTYKGPNLAGLDPKTQKLTRLFNPRRDRWLEHFRWVRGRLSELTPIGRATIDVLRINRGDAIAVRQSLLEEGVVF